MKIFLTTLVICFTIFAFSQKVTVTRNEVKIKSESAEGSMVQINGPKDVVGQVLNKFLKDYGKVRSAGDYLTIANPVVGGTSYEKNMLYATIEGDELKTRVWLGLKKGEWAVDDINALMSNIEQLIYQFGVKFYRDQVQVQIDEAQQAYDATERKGQRLISQNKDLNNKLLNNEQEKIRLEKALEMNKQEHAILLQKIENNKKSQDSVANAGVQIKKVLETHKERQGKIN